jgi:hypothetical protein
MILFCMIKILKLLINDVMKDCLLELQRCSSIGDNLIATEGALISKMALIIILLFIF